MKQNKNKSKNKTIFVFILGLLNIYIYSHVILYSNKSYTPPSPLNCLICPYYIQYNQINDIFLQCSKYTISKNKKMYITTLCISYFVSNIQTRNNGKWKPWCSTYEDT